MYSIFFNYEDFRRFYFLVENKKAALFSAAFLEGFGFDFLEDITKTNSTLPSAGEAGYVLRFFTRFRTTSVSKCWFG